MGTKGSKRNKTEVKRNRTIKGIEGKYREVKGNLTEDRGTRELKRSKRN
jgi:hypothetical protein